VPKQASNGYIHHDTTTNPNPSCATRSTQELHLTYTASQWCMHARLLLHGLGHLRGSVEGGALQRALRLNAQSRVAVAGSHLLQRGLRAPTQRRVAAEVGQCCLNACKARRSRLHSDLMSQGSFHLCADEKSSSSVSFLWARRESSQSLRKCAARRGAMHG
jgi:hypothetical protein